MTNLLKNILLFAAISANFQLFSVKITHDEHIWKIRYVNQKSIYIFIKPSMSNVDYSMRAFEIKCPQGYIFVPEQHEIQGWLPSNNTDIQIRDIYILKKGYNSYHVYDAENNAFLGRNPLDLNLEAFLAVNQVNLNDSESQEYKQDAESDSENNAKNDTEQAKYFLPRNKKSIISGVTGFVLGMVGLKLFQEIKKSKKNKPKKKTSK